LRFADRKRLPIPIRGVTLYSVNWRVLKTWAQHVLTNIYCIIENVLSPEQADAIADEVRELEARLEIQPNANVFEGVFCR
jgi:hypothetical protein